jgi:antitoxin ChpS
MVITVPEAFIEQNQLHEGSPVELSVTGQQLTVTVGARHKYKLDVLLAEMPEDKLPSVSGWDEIESVGTEWP